MKRCLLLATLIHGFIFIAFAQGNKAIIDINGNKNKYELNQSNEDSSSKDSGNQVIMHAKGSNNALKLAQNRKMPKDSLSKKGELNRTWALLGNTNIIVSILAGLVVIIPVIILGIRYIIKITRRSI